MGIIVFWLEQKWIMNIITRVLQIIPPPPLKEEGLFSHTFEDLENFEERFFFLKNLAEILGSVYLHEFWWGALISTFFLLILVRICTVKPLFCKNFPAARAKFLGSAYFRIFSRSAYYFHFSAFRKFWRALIILRKSSEMTLERLLRGGLLFAIPGYCK